MPAPQRRVEILPLRAIDLESKAWGEIRYLELGRRIRSKSWEITLLDTP